MAADCEESNGVAGRGEGVGGFFPRKACGPPPQVLTYSWIVLGCSMPSTLSLISTAFCWLLKA